MIMVFDGADFGLLHFYWYSVTNSREIDTTMRMCFRFQAQTTFRRSRSIIADVSILDRMMRSYT